MIDTTEKCDYATVQTIKSENVFSSKTNSKNVKNNIDKSDKTYNELMKKENKKKNALNYNLSETKNSQDMQSNMDNNIDENIYYQKLCENKKHFEMLKNKNFYKIKKINYESNANEINYVEEYENFHHNNIDYTDKNAMLTKYRNSIFFANTLESNLSICFDKEIKNNIEENLNNVNMDENKDILNCSENNNYINNSIDENKNNVNDNDVKDNNEVNVCIDPKAIESYKLQYEESINQNKVNFIKRPMTSIILNVENRQLSKCNNVDENNYLLNEQKNSNIISEKCNTSASNILKKLSETENNCDHVLNSNNSNEKIKSNKQNENIIDKSSKDLKVAINGSETVNSRNVSIEKSSNNKHTNMHSKKKTSKSKGNSHRMNNKVGKTKHSKNNDDNVLLNASQQMLTVPAIDDIFSNNNCNKKDSSGISKKEKDSNNHDEQDKNNISENSNNLNDKNKLHSNEIKNVNCNIFMNLLNKQNNKMPEYPVDKTDILKRNYTPNKSIYDKIGNVNNNYNISTNGHLDESMLSNTLNNEKNKINDITFPVDNSIEAMFPDIKKKNENVEKKNEKRYKKNNLNELNILNKDENHIQNDLLKKKFFEKNPLVALEAETQYGSTNEIDFKYIKKHNVKHAQGSALHQMEPNENINKNLNVIPLYEKHCINNSKNENETNTIGLKIANITNYEDTKKNNEYIYEKSKNNELYSNKVIELIPNENKNIQFQLKKDLITIKKNDIIEKKNPLIIYSKNKTKFGNRLKEYSLKDHIIKEQNNDIMNKQKISNPDQSYKYVNIESNYIPKENLQELSNINNIKKNYIFNWELANKCLSEYFENANNYFYEGIKYSDFDLNPIPTLGFSKSSNRVQLMFKASLPSKKNFKKEKFFIKKIPVYIWIEQFNLMNKYNGEYVTDGENFVMEASSLAFLSNYHPGICPKLYKILYEPESNLYNGINNSIYVDLNEFNNFLMKQMKANIEGYIILISEFFNEDILDYIDRKQKKNNMKINNHEKLFIMHQCLKLLIRLHNAGLSHLDLTPENILISDKYEIRLCDLAKSTPLYSYNLRHLKTTTNCLLPFESCEPTIAKGSYMPPECWKIYWKYDTMKIRSPLKDLKLITDQEKRKQFYFNVANADKFMLGVFFFWIWANGNVWKYSDPVQDEDFFFFVKCNMDFNKFEITRKWPTELKHIIRELLRYESRNKLNINDLSTHPLWSINL